MKSRREKNILIGILCTALVFMTIGYAILSQVLIIKSSAKITGNWDIYIESVMPSYINGDAKSHMSEIGIDKLSATFKAELLKPNDYVEYKVVVRNNGTINAKLTSASLVQKKISEYIEITTTAIKDTDLLSGDTMEFIVKIKFKDVESFTANDETINALTELQLNFVQIEGSIVDNGDTDTKDCFELDQNGVITKYNYSNSCSNHVVIPASFNGKNITSIAKMAFSNANLKVGYVDDTAYIYLVDSSIEQTLKNVLCQENDLNCTTNTTIKEAALQLNTIIYNETQFNEKFIDSSDIEYWYFDGFSMPTKSYHNVTSLDLSNATNLIIIEDEAFLGFEGSASEGQCGSETEGTCYKGPLTSITFSQTSGLIIGKSAFQYNNLTTLNIPLNVSSGTDSFSNNKLTSLTISNDNAYNSFRCNPLLNSTNVSALKLTALGSFAC